MTILIVMTCIIGYVILVLFAMPLCAAAGEADKRMGMK
jgi:hypothetical protein